MIHESSVHLTQSVTRQKHIRGIKCVINANFNVVISCTQYKWCPGHSCSVCCYLKDPYREWLHCLPKCVCSTCPLKCMLFFCEWHYQDSSFLFLSHWPRTWPTEQSSGRLINIKRPGEPCCGDEGGCAVSLVNNETFCNVSPLGKVDK